ncbi:MAG: M56 family metallopeptidase, partial [Lachnospiraceae bacterium]|nr:M56 family metallopeptidase [Lachnospiraceae bacterium]
SIESVLSLIPSAQTIAPEIMYTPEPAIHSGLLVINTVVNPVLTNAFAPGTGDSANPLQILIPVMAAVWLAGILVMLALAGISCLRLRRRVRTAVLLRENIYQSENVSSPFVFGFLRPRIYLPFGVDDRTMSNVILHEQAHIARHDHQGKILGYLLLGLYWFNPLCWAAYLLFCRDIELACDEQVIRGLGREERADYSEALLALSAPRLGVHICPLAFGEIGVKERVRNVLNYKKPAFWAAAAAIAVCIVMAVCFLTNPKQGTGMDDSRKGEDSVRCWFDEYENPQKDFWSGSWEITLAEFPGVTFRASWGKVEAVTESGVTELFGGMPIWNVYFADLGGDGLPELCATVSYGSGIIDEHIIVYDYAKQEEYTLWERGVYDYVLRPENEKLTVRRSEYMNLEEFVKGNLQLTAGENGVLRLEMARDILKGKYYTMKTDEE